MEKILCMLWFMFILNITNLQYFTGAIFLRRFRLYVLSFMFRFMFSNICFRKIKTSRFILCVSQNITWNETWKIKFYPLQVMLSININHNMGFFMDKILCFDSCNQTWHGSKQQCKLSQKNWPFVNLCYIFLISC